MRSLLALVCAVAAALALAAPATAAGTFRNPVLPQAADGEDSPDPWIFRHDGRYWLMYTSTDHVELRSGRTLTGLADAKPRRLWPPVGTTEPPERCCQLWAPELHRLDGPSGRRWYLYYAANAAGGGVGHQMHVLESAGDDPAGPYRHKARLDLPDAYAIDGTVARIGGRLYLLYSGGESFAPTSLMLVELANPWTPTGTPIAISRPELPWEQVATSINEGPQVLLRGSTLNVVYSASWCGTGAYKLGLLSVPARANLLDPATWASAKRPDPIFAASPQAGVFGPGHGSFFTSPDGRESWTVYHATEDDRGCFTGGLRTTRAQRIDWNADGTPRLGQPLALARDLAAPSGDAAHAVQVERALAQRPPGARLVSDRRLAGYEGLAVRRGALALQVRVPSAGRWRVGVRLLGGERGATVTVGRGERRARAGPGLLDFGARRLRAGRLVLRLRTDRAVMLDQVVLERLR